MVLRVRLVDRSAEKQMIRQVLDSVRGGMSGALVLRGEPGSGEVGTPRLRSRVRR